jgi:hypothetical protein
MDKTYARNRDIYMVITILGLILVINTIRIQNYIWLYDGIVLGISIIAILIGIWGILVPYVKIKNETIRIQPSMMKYFVVKQKDIKEWYVDNANFIIELRTADKTYEIKLKNVRKRDRKKLKEDLAEITP